MSNYRTMYAVVEDEAFINDCNALFDDQTHAEIYADQLNGDEDIGGNYTVVIASVDLNGIVEQSEDGPASPACGES